MNLPAFTILGEKNSKRFIPSKIAIAVNAFVLGLSFLIMIFLGTKQVVTTGEKSKHSNFGSPLSSLRSKLEHRTFFTKTLVTGNLISRIWVPLNAAISAPKSSSTAQRMRQVLE